MLLDSIHLKGHCSVAAIKFLNEKFQVKLCLIKL
jgi:hypothetical protein